MLSIFFDSTWDSLFIKDASAAEAICTKVKYPPWANTDVNPAKYATVSNSRSPAVAMKHPTVMITMDRIVGCILFIKSYNFNHRSHHSDHYQYSKCVKLTTILRLTLKVTLDGADFFRTNMLKISETIGVHLLIALYIGIFIPCNAVRLTVECRANNKLAKKKRLSRPSFLNEYFWRDTQPTALYQKYIINVPFSTTTFILFMLHIYLFLSYV